LYLTVFPFLFIVFFELYFSRLSDYSALHLCIPLRKENSDV
jgi:hypothetical protein